jgi:hypothetical protein
MTSAARRVTVGTLFAIALLVPALSAVPAGANPTRSNPNATPPAEVTGLPKGEVEKVLATVPLEDLNAAKLSELLSKLPGFSALPTGQLQQALTKVLEELAGKGDTLEQLGNPGELVSKLETELKALLSPTELLSLLKGKSLETFLTEAVGSPRPAELIYGLLNSATSPEQLVEQVLADVNPEKLETLLGTTLAGQPIIKTTVGQLASDLGANDEEVASSVNTTSTELPESAMALTTALANGKTLGVLDGAKELGLATLAPAKEGASGGSGGSGGSSGSGGGSGSSGSGGSGGASGSGGSAGSTTVVMNTYPAQGANAAAAGKAGKVKIVSRKVHGSSVTLVVQVPGAGRLTLAGGGIRAVSEQTSKAERLTLRTSLTKAALASRRKRHRAIKLKLKASFTPVQGSSSTATTTVAFS